MGPNSKFGNECGTDNFGVRRLVTALQDGGIASLCAIPFSQRERCSTADWARTPP